MTQGKGEDASACDVVFDTFLGGMRYHYPRAELTPALNKIVVPQTVVVTSVPTAHVTPTTVPARTRVAPRPHSVENGNIPLQLSLKPNNGRNQFYLRLVLPKLDGLQNMSSPDMWVAIPQEIGSVGPVNDRQSSASHGLFGLKVDPHTGLPHAAGSVESVTNADGTSFPVNLSPEGILVLLNQS